MQSSLHGAQGVIKRNSNQRVLIGQINTHINKPQQASDLMQSGSPNNRIGTGKDNNDNNSSLLSTPLKNKSVPLNLSINQGLMHNNAPNRRDNSLIAVKKSQSVAKQASEGSENKLNLSIDVLSSNNKQNVSLMMQNQNALD